MTDKAGMNSTDLQTDMRGMILPDVKLTGDTRKGKIISCPHPMEETRRT